jgi:predicted DCC family thiol-disulfide oxidoreductase YuxK
MPSPDDPYLLIYDSDCCICVNFKRMIDFLDPRQEIAFFTLRDADDLGRLSSIPISLRKKSST